MKRILLAILILSVASICYAADGEEEITLTTYYPAPYGEYSELSVSGNTYLAGEVRIGDTTNGYTLPNTDGNAGEALITDGSGTISWGSVGAAGGGSAPVPGTVVGGGYVEWSTFGEHTHIIGCGGMWGEVEQNASKTLSVKSGVNASLRMTGSPLFKVGITLRRRDYYHAIQN